MSKPYYLIERRSTVGPMWLVKVVSAANVRWSYGCENAKRYTRREDAEGQVLCLGGAERLESTVTEHMDIPPNYPPPKVNRQEHSGDDVSYGPLIQQGVRLIESVAAESMAEELRATRTLLAMEREMHAQTRRERDRLRDAVLAHRAAIKLQRDSVSSWGDAANVVVKAYSAVTEALKDAQDLA